MFRGLYLAADKPHARLHCHGGALQVLWLTMEASCVSYYESSVFLLFVIFRIQVKGHMIVPFCHCVCEVVLLGQEKSALMKRPFTQPRCLALLKRPPAVSASSISSARLASCLLPPTSSCDLT